MYDIGFCIYLLDVFVYEYCKSVAIEIKKGASCSQVIFEECPIGRIYFSVPKKPFKTI